jgi:hypothetical protein
MTSVADHGFARITKATDSTDFRDGPAGEVRNTNIRVIRVRFDP